MLIIIYTAISKSSVTWRVVESGKVFSPFLSFAPLGNKMPMKRAETQLGTIFVVLLSCGPLCPHKLGDDKLESLTWFFPPVTYFTVRKPLFYGCFFSIQDFIWHRKYKAKSSLILYYSHLVIIQLIFLYESCKIRRSNCVKFFSNPLNGFAR